MTLQHIPWDGHSRDRTAGGAAVVVQHVRVTSASHSQTPRLPLCDARITTSCNTPTQMRLELGYLAEMVGRMCIQYCMC